MLNIIVPMAGRGSRFLGHYDVPKPLIKIHGTPMIQLVISNLEPKQEHRFVFLCLQEHIDSYQIDKILVGMCQNAVVIPVTEVTEGAACTVLLARDYINSDEPLMIANCDQWVNADINEYLSKMKDNDGLIMTMNSSSPKWSYVDLEEGLVKRVVEKEVISNEATVGIYNFSHGKDFVAVADKMIKNNDRCNNEFYVAPAYNYLIAEGKMVVTDSQGEVNHCMYGLGTPEDLDKFLSLDISLKACVKAKHGFNL